VFPIEADEHGFPAAAGAAGIDELVESGAERGVQVAVYRHGAQVVDAVAGVADPAMNATTARTGR
jgi:hypothetical protein